MANLKARLERLHSQSIGDVSSEIVIKKGKKELMRQWHGQNMEKVIRLVVRF
jgi:hypothetical protein